ncbi:MAG TPA: DUF4337 family protein [Candidatus Baltobacteraceae bacterium]|nr:DUF4337 family protein [Candidatus Baltobacteraceae bacterium]
MPEFHTHHALAEAGERHEQLTEGNKLVPIAAAVIAVLAALATLFSNHSSVSGLQQRTLAGIYQTRAADSYSYYESSRIKIEVNQSMIQSGLVSSAPARAAMTTRVDKEQKKSAATLEQAKKNEETANEYLESAEKRMTSYEHFEWSATLFEVAVVLVSITALMRQHTLMYVGFVATAIGLIFFGLGFF